MTKEEQAKLNEMAKVIAKTANDVEWIVASNKNIVEHLQSLNGSVSNNKHNLDITMTTLYGKNSDTGLVGKVCSLDKTIKRLMIAVAVISASVGGGAYGLIEALL